MDKNSIVLELKALITEGKEKILPTKWIAPNIFGARPGVDEGIFSGWYARSISFLKMFLDKSMKQEIYNIREEPR